MLIMLILLRKRWLKRPDLLQSPEMAQPGLSTKNTEKLPPPARNSGLPEFTPKNPKNTEKIPPKYQNDHFWYFFGIFGGIFLGFQNFGQGGIFSVFFVESPGWAISGLCSSSGHSCENVDKKIL